MKYEITKTFWLRRDELNDIDTYAAVWIVKNDSPNSDKTQLVVVHSGRYFDEMREETHYPQIGGWLKVYPNQTLGQVNRRMNTYIRGYEQRHTRSWAFDKAEDVHEKLNLTFGKVKAKTMIKAVDMNLHYMAMSDGSAALEGDHFVTSEAIAVRSVEPEDKPIGWGAW